MQTAGYNGEHRWKLIQQLGLNLLFICSFSLIIHINKEHINTHSGTNSPWESKFNGIVAAQWIWVEKETNNPLGWIQDMLWLLFPIKTLQCFCWIEFTSNGKIQISSKDAHIRCANHLFKAVIEKFDVYTSLLMTFQEQNVLLALHFWCGLLEYLGHVFFFFFNPKVIPVFFNTLFNVKHKDKWHYFTTAGLFGLHIFYS